jgi:hypothetical protein
LHEDGEVFDDEITIEGDSDYEIHCSVNARILSDEGGHAEKVVGSMREYFSVGMLRLSSRDR